MDRVFQFLDYREYLKYHHSKMKESSSFSMRQFARMLEISPSRLSEVLRGIGNISPKTAKIIAAKLELSSPETGYFLLLTESASEKNPAEKKKLQHRIAHFRRIYLFKKITTDDFTTIGNFIDLSILEMLSIQKLSTASEGLAEQLDISLERLEIGIQRLAQLDYIFFDKAKDSWSRKLSHVKIGDQSPEASIRAFQTNMLDRAKKSLQNDPMEKRDFRSLIFAIPSHQYDEFIDELSKFLLQTIEAFSDHGQNNQIFALTTQFFPLSKEPLKRDRTIQT